MLNSLKYITSVCLLSSSIFCGAAETDKAVTKENPQILLAQALKKTDEQRTVSSSATIPFIRSVMQDDPSVFVLLGLENYVPGSLARTVSNVAMLQKLISIDEKLQRIVDILSSQSSQ